MLIRFVCQPGDLGIFKAAYNQQRGDVLSADDRQQLDQLLEWFERNLRKPTSFVRTKSKGHYRREPVAISWFKDDAKECIDRVWRMVRIIENCGISVEMVRTTRPGYVTYEDENQVTALPFADE